jgi:hypothetical protein
MKEISQFKNMLQYEQYLCAYYLDKLLSSLDINQIKDENILITETFNLTKKAKLMAEITVEEIVGLEFKPMYKNLISKQ